MELTPEKKMENKRERAEKRVKKLKGFFYHAAAFFFIIPALAFINYQGNGWRYMWFLWPVLGWGIAVMIHAVAVFGIVPFLKEDWERKKIRQFMEREEEEELKKWK